MLKAHSSILFSFLLPGAIGSAMAADPAPSNKPRFINPPTLSQPPGYSHVVEVPAGNRLVYISGQIAVDAAGKVVGTGDLQAQTVQVFENLRNALAAVGATFNDVVKLNYYLLDASNLAAVREVRNRYVNTATPPASTLVEVRRLAREELLVEIEAVAVIQSR